MYVTKTQTKTDIVQTAGVHTVEDNEMNICSSKEISLKIITSAAASSLPVEL